VDIGGACGNEGEAACGDNIGEQIERGGKLRVGGVEIEGRSFEGASAIAGLYLVGASGGGGIYFEDATFEGGPDEGAGGRAGEAAAVELLAVKNYPKGIALEAGESGFVGGLGAVHGDAAVQIQVNGEILNAHGLIADCGLRIADCAWLLHAIRVRGATGNDASGAVAWVRDAPATRDAKGNGRTR
jgi:hypothetical protein